jgi:hypothetical protein
MKIELFCHTYEWWVWCRKTEAYAETYLIFTVKYGGESLMLWGYFASIGLEALVKVNGIMNFTMYQDILAKNLVAFARRLKLDRIWTFQRDNNTEHT